jgi:hypothetical protein
VGSPASADTAADAPERSGGHPRTQGRVAGEPQRDDEHSPSLPFLSDPMSDYDDIIEEQNLLQQQQDNILFQQQYQQHLSDPAFQQSQDDALSQQQYQQQQDDDALTQRQQDDLLFQQQQQDDTLFQQQQDEVADMFRELQERYGQE